MIMMGILALLTFVVVFGGSIVINMIFHRWWLNLIVYVLIIGYLIVRYGGVGVALYLPFAVSLISAVLAALGVRSLRNQGYRLFQERKKQSDP